MCSILIHKYVKARMIQMDNKLSQIKIRDLIRIVKMEVVVLIHQISFIKESSPNKIS